MATETCEYNVSKHPDDPDVPCGRTAVVRVYPSGTEVHRLCQRHWDKALAWYASTKGMSNIRWEDL